MTDARWLDVDDDLTSAIGHFGRSVEIFERGGFSGTDLQSYMARMALMQAMQSGYTSLEGAFERILELLGEEKPTGPNYHADLLRRLSREITGIRPAIIHGTLVEAIDEARRFRHVARKSYDSFHVEGAASAVRAAAVIRDQIRSAVAMFRQRIDSEE
ncbi:MAG: hypothetical protein ACTHJ3_08425 [Pararhizobium sp.]